MPVVTALRATRRGRVTVHVDGEFVCTVSDALVARWRLHTGRELDAEAVEQLRVHASSELALADAYRLLSHRSRSREELRRRLLQKEHAAEAVSAALEVLAADGFVDDAQFARSYVADKRRLAGWGGERIRLGLVALGVDRASVDAALGAAAEEAQDDELERAVAVLSRKGPPQPPLDAARRRAYQALLRRGFASAVAYAAVRRWSGGEGGDADFRPGDAGEGPGGDAG
jgi:regulatory protein